MTDTLAPADRARLRQLLALAEAAANPADGERLAALAAAERLLGRYGLRLRDLPGLMGGEPEAVAWRSPSPPWRTAAADCLNQVGRLTPWEREFLASLVRGFGG